MVQFDCVITIMVKMDGDRERAVWGEMGYNQQLLPLILSMMSILGTKWFCRECSVCTHMLSKIFVCIELVAVAARKSYRCIYRIRKDFNFNFSDTQYCHRQTVHSYKMFFFK